MTHDPLCPICVATDGLCDQNCAACQCDLIAKVREDAIAECILLGYRHIDRINEEAEDAISEQVANQLFMNADGIEFFVSKLRALQTLREEKK